MGDEKLEKDVKDLQKDVKDLQQEQGRLRQALRTAAGKILGLSPSASVKEAIIKAREAWAHIRNYGKGKGEGEDER
jgi:transposase